MLHSLLPFDSLKLINTKFFPFLLLGRILKKGKLLKIKTFLAQEANTVWNEFNQTVSALVNERIDQVHEHKFTCTYTHSRTHTHTHTTHRQV